MVAWYIRFWSLIVAVELIRFGAAFQVGFTDDQIWDIVKDFPLLVIFGVSFYFVAKWMVRLLDDQRAGLKEVYETNQKFINTLLKQIEQRQNRMDQSITDLASQCKLLHSTISEVAKVDDVIDRLLEEIRKQKG